jgi:hypothetical protein
MTLSWRWSVVPAIAVVWALLILAGGYLPSDLSRSLALLIVLGALVASGVIGGYVLRSGWSVLAVPAAIYVSCAFFLIPALGEYRSLDVFLSLSALLLIVLILTAGAPAGVTAYLALHIITLPIGLVSRTLPLLVVLSTFVAGLAGLSTFVVENRSLFPWATIVFASVAALIGAVLARRADSPAFARLLGIGGTAIGIGLLSAAVWSLS